MTIIKSIHIINSHSSSSHLPISTAITQSYSFSITLQFCRQIYDNMTCQWLELRNAVMNQCVSDTQIHITKSKQ